MTHECTKCSTTTSIPIDVNWEGFACRNCKTLFGKNPKTGAFEKKTTFKRPRYNNTLEIGTQCRLDFDDWTVMGYTEQDILNTNGDGWCEYFLTNENGEMRYLSVYNGYWILAKEEAYEASRFDNTKTVFMSEGEFMLYSEERFKTVFAEGFFPENIPLGPRLSKDYILPPETILAEIDNSDTKAFRGRRLSRQEILQAFPKAQLPRQKGTDVLDPSFYFMQETVSILACTGAILLVLMFWSYTSSKLVTKGQISLRPNKDSIVLTQPFVLNKSKQTLSVETQSNLNNNWMSVGVNLINTETGEEQFAENEISYYYGSEDGESWSEGNRSSEVRFCNVHAGKYILAFNLFKPSDDKGKSTTYDLVYKGSEIDTLVTYNHDKLSECYYRVEEDSSESFVAFFVAIAALVAFALLASHLEQRRWKYSKFTPYPVSEEE